MRIVLGLVVLAACAPLESKGPEEDAPLATGGGGDDKDDSLRKPTEHGALPFGAAATAEITAAAGHHAWTFTLAGPARVTAATAAPTPRAPEVDTVLYLYRRRPDGTWGAYIARNDDAGDSLWSRVDASLEGGSYRLVVKGYDRAARGAFALRVVCAGDGCAPPNPACVLGDTARDIAQQPALAILNRNVYTAATPLSPADAARVVTAVQQGTHAGVATAAEAFARVDEGEIVVTWVGEPLARRTFVVLEYTAGGSAHGAVFGDGTALVAVIREGNLLGCVTPAAACRLPASYRALLADPAFERAATQTVTVAAPPSGVTAAQVLAALQRIYGAEAPTVTAGLALADRQQAHVTRLTHRSTRTALVAVELGAGDTSVGAVYFEGGTTLAAVIEDGAIDGCAFLAPVAAN